MKSPHLPDLGLIYWVSGYLPFTLHGVITYPVNCSSTRQRWHKFYARWREARAEAPVYVYDYMLLPAGTTDDTPGVEYHVHQYHEYRNRYLATIEERISSVADIVHGHRREHGPRAHVPLWIRRKVCFLHVVDGVTLEDLADATGLTAMTISKWILAYRKEEGIAFNRIRRGERPLRQR